MLEARFVSLWNRINARGSAGLVYTDLALRYSEPHRTYHNLNHITDCLDEFDKVRRIVTHPDVLEFALWFHDVVYDPQSRINEISSAELAVGVARRALLSTSFSDMVRELILTTRHYGVRSERMDVNLMADIDMAILGQPDQVFDNYEHAIRQEYSMFSDAEFMGGRVDFLKKLLQRQRIYFTGAFYYKYEDKARKNLKRSIERLSRMRPRLVRRR